MVFSYLLSIPVWLLTASLLSQFYTHTRGKTTLHPLIHLPIIGLLGASSQFCALQAAKVLYLGDMLVVILISDTLAAAVIGVCILGLERQDLHDRFVKEYAILIVILYLYFYGDGAIGSDGNLLDNSVMKSPLEGMLKEAEIRGVLLESPYRAKPPNYQGSLFMMAFARSLHVARVMFIK